MKAEREMDRSRPKNKELTPASPVQLLFRLMPFSEKGAHLPAWSARSSLASGSAFGAPLACGACFAFAAFFAPGRECVGGIVFFAFTEGAEKHLD